MNVWDGAATANNWTKLKMHFNVYFFSIFRTRIVCVFANVCIVYQRMLNIQKTKYKDILIDWKSQMYVRACVCVRVCTFIYIFVLSDYCWFFFLFHYFCWLLSFTYARNCTHTHTRRKYSLKLNWTLNHWHRIVNL